MERVDETKEAAWRDIVAFNERIASVFSGLGLLCVSSGVLRRQRWDVGRRDKCGFLFKKMAHFTLFCPISASAWIVTH